MRRAGFWLAALASWAIVVLWAARVDVRAPIAPAETREFDGSEFLAVFGSGKRDAGRLHVESPGEDYTSLESLRVDVDAASFPTLRYRFAGFPRTLELSLVFRTAEDPDDVRTIALPWPGAGTQTFDLSRLEEWQGRIVELGFAQFPTAQLVPPAEGFRPFALVRAELSTRSWTGSLAALATDWFGDWPWTQRSVHALGRDTTTPRARPIVLCAAIAAAIAIGWRALLFGWRDRRFLAHAALAAAVAWIALDAVWQAGLWGRLQTTRAVYAERSWNERARTVGDTDIADAAKMLTELLRNEPAETRILVSAGSGYELLRLIWHLLPRNAAVYAYAASVGSALPEGTLIVFYDDDDWRTKPYWRKLLKHSEYLATSGSIHGDSFESKPLVVFRFRHGR